MKRKFLFLIMAFVSVVAFGQNWTRETAEEFEKDKNAAVVVDLSEATVMDVKMEDFPAYFSGKFSANEKYASLVLEKFKNRFSSNFFTTLKKNSVSVEEARFVITCKFEFISEKAGFSGVYWVNDGDNKSEVVPFEQKDGRWNEFEKLLLENADKFWSSNRFKPKASGLFGKVEKPFYIELISKKK